METRALLERRIAETALCPGTATVDAWLAARWLRYPVGRFNLPFLPLWGLKKAHVAHDVHHALLELPTVMRAEYELAAWELASGGCAWNAFFWFDRIVIAAVGLLVAPRATLRGFRSGLGKRNLYGSGVEELLESDVEKLRAWMGLDAPEL